MHALITYHPSLSAFLIGVVLFSTEMISAFYGLDAQLIITTAIFASCIWMFCFVVWYAYKKILSRREKPPWPGWRWVTAGEIRSLQDTFQSRPHYAQRNTYAYVEEGTLPGRPPMWVENLRIRRN